MEIGQKVKHLLSGEVLVVKKINKNIATCIRTPFKNNGIIIDIAICNVKNLILST